MSQHSPLNYEKISNSQVLLHPNPKGVIQFVGSFIFGSFPVFSYKYLLQFLYDKGYSLILYRFPCNLFQFNHWEVSFSLLSEHQILKSRIIELLRKESKNDVIDTYLNEDNYLWLGHSLGCKYIILLEILSNQLVRRTQILQKCLGNSNTVLKFMRSENQDFIRDQPSILLAPEISNTVRFLKSSLRISNPLTVPNQQETECLICSSQELFNLTGVISFSWDDIAEDDVQFLVNQLKDRYFQPPLYEELQGWHFEPLGIHIEELGHIIDSLAESLKHRRETS